MVFSKLSRADFMSLIFQNTFLSRFIQAYDPIRSATLYSHFEFKGLDFHRSDAVMPLPFNLILYVTDQK